uniref:Fork-head domain-containing protein n=1 Tax=Terrapene triunguis TaxID=2587831 RepID=A0A674IN54_9SAUR
EFDVSQPAYPVVRTAAKSTSAAFCRRRLLPPPLVELERRFGDRLSQVDFYPPIQAGSIDQTLVLKVPQDSDEDASSVDISLPQKMETPKSKAVLALQKPKVPRSLSKKLKYILQASTKIKGGWPRPPLNYCILITLALRNSAEGSLTVQQIYQFTRQHFPFFQTAPDGWKNTIRHNLCFSSSFEKTSHFVCNEGNRKSRLWKLTPEGCRKFQEEIRALSEEALDLVSQSLSKPGTYQETVAPTEALELG